MSDTGTTRLGTPRVWVTGIGLVTGFGPDREHTWSSIKRGESAARAFELPDDPWRARHFGFRDRQSDRHPTDDLHRAALQACDDARLALDTIDRDRVGTVIGFGKGDLKRLGQLNRRRIEARADGVELRGLPRTWPNLGAAAMAAVGDFRGPSLAPVAACATGVVAVLRAAELIRQGACDLAIAGAGDSTLDPLVLAAFRKMGVTARGGDGMAPAGFVRPWNRDRDGFLVGEGAALLVLEDEAHARARGALPHAEIAGGALGADAYHLTGLNPDPTNLAHVIGLALRRSGLGPSDIDHVNVHGTATRDNDPLECRAIRKALGAHADSVSCSANKAQIGHCLGAAGAVELAITCLAIRDGFVPPTLNLTDPGPDCDLDGTPLVGKPRSIRAALKLSLGFGGHLAAAVLRAPDGPRRGPIRDG